MANTATIRIQDIQFDWVPGETYTFNLDKGLVKEVGGNRLLSDTQTNILSFTTPTTYGTLTNVSPTFNSTGIYWPKINLTYDRTVANVNTGSFYLYKVASPSDVLIATIAGTDTRVSTSLSTATIDLSTSYDLFEGSQQYYITSQPKTVTDIFNFPVETVDSTKVKFTYKDGPSLITVNPVSTSTGIFLPQVKLTYDRALTKFPISKNFYLYRRDTGSDSLILTLNNSDPRVITSGTTATINLSQEYDLFSPLKQYYITSESGTLRDQFYLPTPAITNTSTVAFTYINNPQLQSVSPALGSTGVVLPSIQLTYDKRLNKGTTSTISLYKEAIPEDLLVLSFPASDSRVVSSNTTTAIINLSNDKYIFDGDASYFLTSGDKILRDAQTYLWTNPLTEGTVGFTYTSNPVVTSVSPSVNSTGTFVSQIRLTFNRPMVKDTGNFLLYSTSSGLVATIPVTTSSVTVANNTCTINISSYNILQSGSLFYMTTEGIPLRDTFGLSYSGMSTSTVRFFQKSVEIVSTYPTYNSNSSYAGTIDLTFNGPVVKNTGTFYVWKEGDPITLYYSVPVSSSTVAVSSSTVSISVNLPEGTYYLTCDAEIVKDTNGLPFRGIFDNSKVRFTQAITSNITNRTYVGNTENILFATNVPQVLDTTTSTYEVTISSDLGEFAPDELGTGSTSTYTLTGSRTQINTFLQNVRFFPNKDSVLSGTYRYKQIKNGLTQIDRTQTLSANSISASTSTYIFTTSTSWTPPYKHTKYQIADVLVVGGGGGGAGGWHSLISGSYAAYEGAGGSAGGFIEQLNQILPRQSYNITVGSGGLGGSSGFIQSSLPTGSLGRAGNTSSFYTFTATGAGVSSSSGAGASGLPTQFVGGGSGGRGGNGSGGRQSGTTGGPGLLSTILGYNVAGGGGGGPNGLGTDGGGRGNNTAAGTNATTYGSGGGGGNATYTFNPTTPRSYNGGSGASGVVAVRFHPPVEPITTTKLGMNIISYPKYNQDRTINQPTLTANITTVGLYSQDKPDGPVTIVDSSSGFITTATLVSSISSTATSASTSTSWVAANLPIGSRTITATYQGDTFNLISTATILVEVTTATILSTNVVESSINSHYTSPVNLQLTIGSAESTSSVILYEGESIISTGTLSRLPGDIYGIEFDNLLFSAGTHNLTFKIAADEIFAEKIINYSLIRTSGQIPTSISGNLPIIGYYGGSPYSAVVRSSTLLGVTATSSNLPQVPADQQSSLGFGVGSAGSISYSVNSDTRFTDGTVRLTVTGFDTLSNPQGYVPVIRTVSVNFTGNANYQGGSYTFNVLVTGP